MHFYSGQFQFTDGFIRKLSHWRASQVTQWYRIHVPLLEMQETRAQSLSLEDPLEKEMATHSSILAWKIPCTEDPGGLQSMGSQSQTLLINWAHVHTHTHTHIHTHSRPLKAEEDVPLKLKKDTREMENEPDVMILQDSCFEALSARKGCMQYSNKIKLHLTLGYSS